MGVEWWKNVGLKGGIFFHEEYVSNEPKPILKAFNFDQPHFICHFSFCAFFKRSRQGKKDIFYISEVS